MFMTIWRGSHNPIRSGGSRLVDQPWKLLFNQLQVLTQVIKALVYLDHVEDSVNFTMSTWNGGSSEMDGDVFSRNCWDVHYITLREFLRIYIYIYHGWKLKNGLEEEVLILVPMLGVLRVQFHSCFKDGITHPRTLSMSIHVTTYHLRRFN